MRALLAFDKFKDCLSASQATEAAAAGLRATGADWEIDRCPLTDGGDGFTALLTQAVGGKVQTRQVTGPRGEPVEASFALVPWSRIPEAARTSLALNPTPAADASVAVLDCASAGGLALLPPAARDPWQATSRGTGELIRHAAQADAAAIVIGAGGTATHDLGLGALAALGLQAFDAHGKAIDDPVPSTWKSIERLDPAPLITLPPIRIASDVRNPLLGRQGAASVYAPQKGLLPEDRSRLEHATARLALMLVSCFGKSDDLLDEAGAGAAGGFTFGFMAATSARLVPGYALVSAWFDLPARMAQADVVLTGEGQFDDSSFQGKATGSIIAEALALGRPAHVFAGVIDHLHLPPGCTAHALNPSGLPPDLFPAAAARQLSDAIQEEFTEEDGD